MIDFHLTNGETFYLERIPRRTIQFKPNGNLSAVYKSLSSSIVDTTRLLIIVKSIYFSHDEDYLIMKKITNTERLDNLIYFSFN